MLSLMSTEGVFEDSHFDVIFHNAIFYNVTSYGGCTFKVNLL